MIEDPADISKFDDIYSKYGMLMYRAAYSVLKNKEDAEDTVQEALIKVAKNISEISKLSCEKTEAFLVTLSRNTAD
jgi:RNA polymerase sigma-70 factor (ECF subfamily)